MEKRENKPELNLEHILTGSILSREEQQKLTPDEVLQILKKGNQEFVEDNLTVRNNSDRIRAAVLGQYPLAVVLSCLIQLYTKAILM